MKIVKAIRLSWPILLTTEAACMLCIPHSAIPLLLMLQKTVINILTTNRELIIATAATIITIIYKNVVVVNRVIQLSMNLQLLLYCLNSTDLYSSHYHLSYHSDCLQRFEFKQIMIVNSRVHECTSAQVQNASM
jgi:hypothetical protein